MEFEFLPPPRIFFGSKQFHNIGTLVKELGSRLFVVASGSALNTPETRETFTVSILKQDFEFDTYLIKGEPTIETIDSGVQKAKEFKAEVIIGIGGGSTVDACKAIAGLFTNGGSAKDYMEVIGKGAVITKPSLPIIAVPTTAGTGSEVTKNAVVLAEEEKFKASIRSPLLIPRIAIIDPMLMQTVPPSVTSTCGMDALTQLIEAYTSRKSQPLTDAWALLGIKKASKSLLTCYRSGQSLEARESMALASLLSGICLANAGLGAVHGFASPLGGLKIPHGVICAALLAPTIKANIKQLKMKDPENTTLVKYAKLAEIVSEKPIPSINDAHIALVDYLKNLTKELNIPTLSEFALTDSDVQTIVEKAMKSSSMKYNPIELKEGVLKEILHQVI
ncbi:MAG: iron-containing alcohol dehydrogenase [Candidatus Heimdallarchaeota archaeon]|nr:MAG: iron-containing alcohol dehydrogenase [Candidatus Heimdallarchaeota archaeon]